MADAKHLNRMIWSLNIALGAGLLAFSGQVLLRAPDNSLLKDVPPVPERTPEVGKPPSVSDDALYGLRNPLRGPEEGAKSPEILFKGVLKGTLPRGAAFLQSSTSNVELVVYVGEEIPLDEYRGWKLASVDRDRATFVHRDGTRADLSIDLNRVEKPSPIDYKPRIR